MPKHCRSCKCPIDQEALDYYADLERDPNTDEDLLVLLYGLCSHCLESLEFY